MKDLCILENLRTFAVEKQIHMKRILVLLFTFISLATMAQTQLLRGKSSYSGDILYTLENGYLYRGKSTYSGDILYSINGLMPLPVLVMMIQ